MSDVDKVIYIDCDIVVNLDIAEMWAIDIENYSLAGVHSKGYENPYERLRDKLNGCDCMTFINAGVLLMNLKKIREKGNLFLNAMSWMKKRMHLMAFSDQDILNNLFYGDIKLIDSKFNFTNASNFDLQPSEMNDKILHTPGSNKVWDITGLPVQKLYWRYFLDSAWGENMSKYEFANFIWDVSRVNAISRKKKSLLVRIFNGVYGRLKHFTPIALTGLLLAELKHRLTNGFKY